MSYKHNNLMAMRHNYWNDQTTPSVMNEKKFFQDTLTEFDIFQPATLDDAKYFFFAMPSIIIVKGYSLGFCNDLVKKMMIDFIQQNKPLLRSKTEFKIQYRV